MCIPNIYKSQVYVENGLFTTFFSEINNHGEFHEIHVVINIVSSLFKAYFIDRDSEVLLHYNG